MAVLLEREHALQQLTAALALARAGTGGTALVCGEAGIGKTVLLQHFIAQSGAAPVWWGGCEALSSPRPLGPVHDMAAELGGQVRALLGREGLRSQLFTAILQHLQSADAPAMMVLEDLHWADAASLDLVKFLARRIARARVLLVVTYRDDELGERHPLRGVLGDIPSTTLTRVPLLPLSESAVAAMAGAARHRAAGVFKASGGNPFFVTEALRADALPDSVRDAVLARASRQGDATRAMLDLIALVPGRVELDIVHAIAAPDSATISAAMSSGLLAADERYYYFRHELARIALEQAVLPPLAAGLHASLLASLRQRSGVAMTRLVHHAAAAGASKAVLTFAQAAAGEAAACGAHREAAEMYATALAHADALAPHRRALLMEQRAYRCYLTDQIDDAIVAQERALAIWRSLQRLAQEGRALRWLSRLYWYAGRNADALHHAELAVQLLTHLRSEPELAWALSNRAQLFMLAGQTAEAVTWGDAALVLAAELGDTEITCHALNNVGTAQYETGLDSGRASLERSLAIALEHDYAEHAARAFVNLVSTAIKGRDYGLARARADAASAYFAERDLDSWSHYLLAWEARMDFEQGRWEAAAAAAGRLVARSGIAPISRLLALTILSRLRRLRGDPGAQPLLEEALRLALATDELQRLAPVAVAAAEAHWIAADDAPLHPIFLRAHARAVQLGDNRVQGELACWGKRLGIHLGAARSPEADDAGTDSHWEQAAEHWKSLDCAYEHAHALLDGDDKARRAALAAFDEMGAAAAAKRCREILREAGMRSVARGPRDATIRNPAGLTARELQILMLLPEGLSNAAIAARLVRSEKTIEHHISAILGKLGVRSRSEAAAVAGTL